MNYLLKAWSYVVYVFEKMDIFPPIIAVSVVHYAGALNRKDPFFIALIIGALVDIGHYRSVKAFVRKTEFKRFILLLVMTLLTGYYHFLWYGDILLTLAMPVLIIALALMSMWDGWEKQAVKVSESFQKEKEKNLETIEKRNWRQLSEVEKKRISTLSVRQVVEEFYQDERTASNWIKWAKTIDKDIK